MTRADLLGVPVDGLAEALDAITAFDDALTSGLSRPQLAQRAALTALADSVAGTPLAGRVAEAVAKAAAGVADEDHLTTLAAARVALLGSAHDALLARVDDVTGRQRPDWAGGPMIDAAAPNLHAAARAWLADVARAGWQGVTHELVAGAGQAISAMLPDVRVRRLAVLLDGFAAELDAGAELDRTPSRRWGDLWSRAMILAQPRTPSPPEATIVSGRVLPLGVDLQEHLTAAQAQVHAVFEPADSGPARLVRASAAVAKPDTVVGMGVWQLLRPHLSLLKAAGDGRSVDITGMTLTATGDLLWDTGSATPGAPADAFATARVALAVAVASPVPPLDRHPIAIAEPVFLDGYTVRDGVLTVAGHDLRIDRLPAAGPLTPALVAKSSACIGLLRWDAGEFIVQPLAVETVVKKKTVAVHAGAWAGGATDAAGVKAEKAAADAVDVLRERAGRLLRK